MPSKEEAKKELAKLIELFNANPRKDSLTEEEKRIFEDSIFRDGYLGQAI